MLFKIVTLIGLTMVLSQGAMPQGANATDNHTEYNRKCDELNTQQDRDNCKRGNPWNNPKLNYRGSGRIDRRGVPSGQTKYQDPSPTPPRPEPSCIKTGKCIVSPLAKVLISK